MSYYVVKGNAKIEISKFIIDLSTGDGSVAISTALTFSNSKDQRLDTCRMDRSLKPLYHSSYSSDSEYSIRFHNNVTGRYYNRQTKRTEQVNEKVNTSFFDSYAYPYLLGLVALQSGYKANLPVYEYKHGKNNHVTLTHREEVKTSSPPQQINSQVLRDSTHQYLVYLKMKKDASGISQSKRHCHQLGCSFNI